MGKLNSNFQVKRLFTTIILLLIMFKSNGQAPQCSVNIINNNGCTAILQIDWFDSSSPSTPCDTQTLTVLPNTPYNPSCSGSCGSSIVNVVYTIIGGITGIGGGGLGYVDVNYQSDSGTTTCSGGTGYYGLAWAPGTLTIQ